MNDLSKFESFTNIGPAKTFVYAYTCENVDPNIHIVFGQDNVVTWYDHKHSYTYGVVVKSSWYTEQFGLSLYYYTNEGDKTLETANFEFSVEDGVTQHKGLTCSVYSKDPS
jgi:hypothetical protein